MKDRALKWRLNGLHGSEEHGLEKEDYIQGEKGKPT